MQGRRYHISALYVVDLKRFRKVAAGDRLRGQYQALSQDPNSLSNLDQVDWKYFIVSVVKINNNNFYPGSAKQHDSSSINKKFTTRMALVWNMVWWCI